MPDIYSVAVAHHLGPLRTYICTNKKPWPLVHKLAAITQRRLVDWGPVILRRLSKQAAQPTNKTHGKIWRGQRCLYRLPLRPAAASRGPRTAHPVAAELPALCGGGSGGGACGSARAGLMRAPPLQACNMRSPSGLDGGAHLHLVRPLGTLLHLHHHVVSTDHCPHGHFVLLRQSAPYDADTFRLPCGDGDSKSGHWGRRPRSARAAAATRHRRPASGLLTPSIAPARAEMPMHWSINSILFSLPARRVVSGGAAAPQAAA